MKKTHGIFKLDTRILLIFNDEMMKRYTIVAKCYDKKGKLLSTATNNYKKTHPLQQHFAKLAGEPYRDKLHAEILALIRAKDKKVHRITIERFDAEGKPALAAPCKTCTCAIEAFGVKYIQHT